MASIKNLKRDVDNLVSELVIDCLNYVNGYNKADKDQAFNIIKEALEVRIEVRNLANHPDGKDNPKLVKAHYRAAVAKFIKSIEDGYEALGKLTTT